MRLYEYGRIFVKTVSIVLLVVLTVLMTGFSKQEAKVPNQRLTLEVALFPYVPDRVRFQEAVSDAWKREHPDVSLHFADWDCYASDPDPSIDVFVFDGIYLSSFVEEGYLLPIPKEKIRNKEDIIPFALKGCISGGSFTHCRNCFAPIFYIREKTTPGFPMCRISIRCINGWATGKRSR